MTVGNSDCRWTCTGILISVDVIHEDWRFCRILAVKTDFGLIHFFDHNIQHFDKIDSLSPGQLVILAGLITSESQSNGGRSPYFLNPETIEAF